MTYEELNSEAKAQGYKLIKIPPKIHFENCPVCGATRRLVHPWSSLVDGMTRFRCDRCGFRADGWSTTEKNAKILWNKAVNEYKEAHHD